MRRIARSPKVFTLVPLFLLYWSFPFVVVKGQSNLFRGFKTGKNNDGIIDDVPLTSQLVNGVVIPLVGLGVGNLQQELVESMVHDGLNDDIRTRLIDTSHLAGNERDVSRGITTGVKDLKEQLAKTGKKYRSKHRVQVHVVTKIWYTYLGYERTKLAIDEILENFEEAIKDPNVDLKITLLLHWPQCYDSIPWMHCKEEEQELPDHVKNAGPPPHLDTDAWKGSWRALEDVYEQHNSAGNNKNDNHDSVIANIGISNFDYRTLTKLLETCRTKPHLAQINIWSLLNEQALIELMNDNGIHLQAHNVINGIVQHLFNNPKAHHHILMVGNQLKRATMDDNYEGTALDQVLFTQTILAWLVQFGISIVPRTSDFEHLGYNSAVSLSKIPTLSEEQIEIVGNAIAGIVNNRDLENDVQLQVRFHAKESDMFLYYVPEEGDFERQLAFIEKGSSYEETTPPGHTFKLYHAYNPDHSETFSIRGHYGETQHIHVEL